MNKARFLLGAALATAALGIVLAQAQPSQADPPRMGGPMMGRGMGMGMGGGMGMMGGPMHQTVMTPFLLPELQSELGLSAQQVTQLRQLKQEMLTKGKDFSTQIAAKRKELEALLAPGTSKGEQVKKLFEQIANLRAQQFYTGYETTTKMKAVLTDPQRAKLAAMKGYEFHQAMMSHMTLNDMSEMMQFMGGGGMMMGGGGMMMGGGMMGPGMMGPGAAPKQ